VSNANIRILPLTTNREALELLQLQMLAYRVEAELVLFADIPPLKDSIASIQSAAETFYGYFEESVLVGAISVQQGDAANELVVCRMMVHPHYFRRGIASLLLQHVIAMRGAARMTVSTVAANVPAIRLYERFGFRERERRELAPGIELVTLTWEQRENAR
jgi:ribosomal protein S18 acetylase RimI-like enzyme